MTRLVEGCIESDKISRGNAAEFFWRVELPGWIGERPKGCTSSWKRGQNPWVAPRVGNPRLRPCMPSARQFHEGLAGKKIPPWPA